MEKVIKDKLDLIVSGKHKTISDLYIQPVSFPQGAEQFIDDVRFRGAETADFQEKWRDWILIWYFLTHPLTFHT